jgi:hypothetical protein
MAMSLSDDAADMQVVWFLQECGEAHLRLCNYGRALKKFSQIEKVRAFVTVTVWTVAVSVTHSYSA